jgi:hypothetical protein
MERNGDESPSTPPASTVAISSLDSQTTTFVLKCLTANPIDESSIAYWCSSLQLLKCASREQLMNNPHFMTMLDSVLLSTIAMQTLFQTYFQELISYLLEDSQ